MERYDRYQGGARKGAERVLSELAIQDAVPKGDLEALWSAETGSTTGFEMILGILRDDFYVREMSRPSDHDVKQTPERMVATTCPCY